jgi:cytochrome c5
MKTIAKISIAGLFALAALSAASAQSLAPTTATPVKPAVANSVKPAVAAPVAAAKPSAAEKSVLSKKCSTDADAKGLKGKERKKFRSQCKAGKA